jgi:hypothetical protein
MSIIDWSLADELTKQQVMQANSLKIEIQKLITSLSTGSLVFSVSLLQIIPKSENSIINKCLIIGWILLGASIIGGVLTLVFGAWEYGNRLMAKAGKCEKKKRNWYKVSAEVYKAIAHFCEHTNIWCFIAAVIFIAVYTISVFNS